jgi:excisionase family DNA binding protein
MTEVSPQEASRLLGVWPEQVYRLVRRGTLDARREGKYLRITRSSVDAYLASAPRSRRPREEHATVIARFPQPRR